MRVCKLELETCRKDLFLPWTVPLSAWVSLIVPPPVSLSVRLSTPPPVCPHLSLCLVRPSVPLLVPVVPGLSNDAPSGYSGSCSRNCFFSPAPEPFNSHIRSPCARLSVSVFHIMKECPPCHPHPLICNAFSAEPKCGLSQLLYVSSLPPIGLGFERGGGWGGRGTNNSQGYGPGYPAGS